MAEIRVYLADTAPLAQDGLFARLYRTLPPERRQKIDGFRFRRDKNLSLGAGVLLYHALARAGVAAPRFTRGPQGKPALAGRQDLHFNLSHGGQRVLCAVSDRPVGCDVEPVTEMDPEIARRFFAPGEYAYLLGAEPARRQETFFRLWTLKESFVKATGLGMALPLEAFWVDLAASPVTVRQGGCPGPWYFREYDAGAGYRCAVCGRTPQFAPPEWVTFR